MRANWFAPRYVTLKLFPLIARKKITFCTGTTRRWRRCDQCPSKLPLRAQQLAKSLYSSCLIHASFIHAWGSLQLHSARPAAGSMIIIWWPIFLLEDKACD